MANIIRYNPANDFVSLREAMDRLFADSFISPHTASNWAGRAGFGANLFETADSYQVQLPLPGVAPQDVDITVLDNAVTVKWETKSQAPEGAQQLWSGMQYGAGEQSFTLPAPVNADNAKASFSDGILHLTLPKVEHAKVKTVKINPDQTLAEQVTTQK